MLDGRGSTQQCCYAFTSSLCFAGVCSFQTCVLHPRMLGLFQLVSGEIGMHCIDKGASIIALKLLVGVQLKCCYGVACGWFAGDWGCQPNQQGSINVSRLLTGHFCRLHLLICWQSVPADYGVQPAICSTCRSVLCTWHVYTVWTGLPGTSAT
jgi:hypothetical protein